MKRRTKIIIVTLALAVAAVLWLSSTNNPAQREVEKTRASLRRQGFKLEADEFDFSTGPELRRRSAQLVTSSGLPLNQVQTASSRRLVVGFRRELLFSVGTNSAVAAWHLEMRQTLPKNDLEQDPRTLLSSERERLDLARQAAVSGPIRFEPVGQKMNLLVPYLAELKELVRAFTMEMSLALQDGAFDRAWESLLAATCLVTEYAPEPMEISHLVRASCATIVWEATWSALQSRHWTEAELAELQRRWEAVDFWQGLEETAAWSRASWVGICRLQRQQKVASGWTLQGTLNSPQMAWYQLKHHWSQIQYRRQGTYEDEDALLKFYSAREIGWRKGRQCSSWLELRKLPELTNSFQSRHPSSVSALMNNQQVVLHWSGNGLGVPARLAEAEARRRLIVTALALERFHRRTGYYPTTLEELSWMLLPLCANDFMDGQPLRYRLTEDGHYVLYSVGLDGVDEGGVQAPRWHAFHGNFGWPPAGTDLVWPRPATPAQIEEALLERGFLLRVQNAFSPARQRYYPTEKAQSPP